MFFAVPSVCGVLQMYVTLVFRTKGTRLTKPTISLTLLCLAMLVGVIRVAEYRNHWADVLAGFFTGGAIAVFLVRREGNVKSDRKLLIFSTFKSQSGCGRK